MRNKNTLWGIFFILAAALIVLYRFGSFGEVSLLSITFAILMIPIIIVSIPRKNFWGILIPMAILLIIFDEPLGIEQLTPWAVLCATFFLCIGFTMIFKGEKPYVYIGGHKGYHGAGNTTSTIDDNQVRCEASFKGSTQYINSSSLERANFACSFGSLKVYFDNATLHPNGAQASVEASFGSVELYIPHSWNVYTNVECSFGSVIEDSRRQIVTDGPVLRLTGQVSFGDLKIIYI